MTVPADYFEAVYQTSLQAQQASGRVDFFYQLAGRTLCQTFAGSALVQRLAPALQHLTAAPISMPSLTICCWDSSSTGIRIPPPPWSLEAYGPRGEIEGYNDGRIFAVYQPGIDTLYLFDRERKLAIYWVAQPEKIPYWESSFPLRTFLHWWLKDEAYQLIHAGAVGTVDGGVLIAGKSGSGKSTSTLACLDSTLHYAGDDYVLVGLEPTPRLHSLYNTAKLEPYNVARFPAIQSLISNPQRLESEKALFFLFEHFPDKLITEFPIRAILLPQVTGRPDTVLSEASAAACLFALAPTTLFHLPGHSDLAFSKISQLTKQVPGFVLGVGTDLSQIPATILRLLETLSP